jgi:probable rRNA maturation factor
MSFQFCSEDVELPELNFDKIVRILKGELRVNQVLLGSINYIFCSDNYLLKLNIEFLKHDYFTDVITFDYSEGRVLAGDIYISIERVKNNSVIYKQFYSDELIRVISHGLLHLLKYNDKEEEEIKMMRQKESQLLGKIKFLV